MIHHFKRRNKYNAKTTIVDGHRFSSQKEATRYQELLLLKKSGEIVFFMMQAPFHLTAGVKYIVDFQIFWKSGEVTFEDVKGHKTEMYKLKKKQVEFLYPIEIVES